MEVLTQLFQAKVRESNQFKLHPQCENLKITHLSFADDLMIFVAADLHSVQLVKDTLDEFKELFGLSVNHSKSEVFCAAVPTVLQDQILSILQFRVGKLLVRYLGMPLIARRLSYSYCIPLIEKITARINS